MYDVVIRGGTVMDGTGSSGRIADIAITDDTITAIGEISAGAAGYEINAAGKIVCPGFIDVHNHTDVQILVNPKAESMIRQGVTTLISGNCGSSPFPKEEEIFEEFREELRENIKWNWTGGISKAFYQD